MERSSGILMPISSLPSPYGIGTIGQAAYDFVDFLAAAGQRWWQLLPVGPTGAGDSPYQSPSVYAGNPYLIDIGLLISDGLLTKKEADAFDFGADASRVDYEKLHRSRPALLKKAAARAREKYAQQIEAFAGENAWWLADYALFMALWKHFDRLPLSQWPDRAVRRRETAAVEKYRTALAEDIDYYICLQYLFYTQWEKLKEYAHGKGIGLIGDMPLYVSPDSADVWASPESFLLDEEGNPQEIAGVPPDYFSKDGQLWGNPLYDYAQMERDGFGWWIRRIDGAGKLYDVIRIDHFRGLESYWATPAGAKTAREGHWVKGPGMRLIGVVKNWFPQLSFIAEDLGTGSPELTQFLEDSGLPGMRVLQFAFDSSEESAYLPHRHIRNCVCYTGTHDNDTLCGWLAHAKKADLKKAVQYMGLSREEGYAWGVIRTGMSSVADLFIAQMQDYLELDSDSRMNVPGTPKGNWRWRMKPGADSKKLTARIAAMTELYGRRA
ncbi:MAG: 4-alpha-glucanotransferase [Lachnospiraceae bacterium]|nr:4-alpha-glucanotransferase [Lachnospiraceae bacterium]